MAAVCDRDIGSDFDSAAELEEVLRGAGSDNLPRPVLSPTQHTPSPETVLPSLRSDLQIFVEKSPWNSTSSMPGGKCVVSSSKSCPFSNHSQICDGTPAWIDGPNIYPTCGMGCSSNLLAQAASGPPNINRPPTSDPPNLSPAPNTFDKNRDLPRRLSKLDRSDANTSIEMCVVSS